MRLALPPLCRLPSALTTPLAAAVLPFPVMTIPMITILAASALAITPASAASPAPNSATPAAAPAATTIDPSAGQEAPPDTRPLSPAQVALFETPHLKSIVHPETLDYRFERIGPQPLADKITVQIETIHPDGTKYVSFGFLTGSNHQFYPAVDNFVGNPLLMIFLEHDVKELRDQTGVAAAWYRDRIREAFIDQAQITDTTYSVGGKAVPAHLITLKPFAHNDRLEKIPTIQQKEYRFVLSDAVPGELAELSAAIPADPANGLPAWSEKISYTGETQ